MEIQTRWRLITSHQNTRLSHLYDVTVWVVMDSFDVFDVAKMTDLYDLKRNKSFCFLILISELSAVSYASLRRQHVYRLQIF